MTLERHAHVNDELRGWSKAPAQATIRDAAMVSGMCRPRGATVSTDNKDLRLRVKRSPKVHQFPQSKSAPLEAGPEVGSWGSEGVSGAPVASISE